MNNAINRIRIVNGTKIVVFIILLTLLGNYFMNVLCYKDTGGGIGMHRFHNENRDSMDIIFFGSSHMHCTADVGYLWDQYGIAGCSLTAGAQKIDAVYYFVKEALKTQKPKAVVVDLFSALPDTIVDDETDLYRASSISWSMDYLEMVQRMGTSMQKDVSWIREAQLKFPLFHSRYQEITKNDFVDDMPYMKGYRGSYEVSSFERPDVCECFDRLEVSAEAISYLNKIEQLTEKSNVQLFYVAAPYILTNEEQMKLNWLEEYARQHNIPMVNFNHNVDGLYLDYASDFRDEQHLNNSGARKVTESLISYVSEYIQFEDHRGDERYDSWNDNSLYLKNREICHLLQTESEVNEYLQKLPLIVGDNLVIITLNGNYNAIPDAYENGLSVFGINQSDYQQGGGWIIQNGKILKRLIGDDYQECMRYGDCESLPNGMNIVVYDTKLEMVVDQAINDIYIGMGVTHPELD